ncbi:ferrous iron transporter B [Gordonia amarae]|uniref:Ferrous iron transport protein B n=2 Tax=Gordonia amarae TaxID=36821 RepID=G7GT75_9ACTN|nr:ferrous iron transporter B [Gordonia amarae]MCS3880074.1 ferrous iron transport protein B [Gordonia amarae]QHN18448.1 ferrous iron transporter B [Gordonia amarae]QHN22930.1 ferrous iron transporter B [Gordonia amarae]QHN31832.1 ferrous iron transporter B [Gordonia amarae]QHN40579.1 ferrous iron transporter B [Gordonia amarae]
MSDPALDSHCEHGTSTEAACPHCDSGSTTSTRTLAASSAKVALIGAPNTGKSTVFNAVTGLKAKTGNYPGVTVSRTVGVVRTGDRQITLEDLPGTYDLTPVSIDEQVVADVLAGEIEGVEKPDAILVVADAGTLRRSFGLIADVISLDLPTVLCLTMLDELSRRGGSIDTDKLSAALGIPVAAIDGRRKGSGAQVRSLLGDIAAWPHPVIDPPPSGTEEWAAWSESVLAEADYRSPEPDPITERIDKVLLHPVIGTLIFFAVMFGFFQTIFALAAPLQDYVETGFAKLSEWVYDVGGDNWFTSFVADALIGGVGGVLVFVPQIALLFVLITFLEQLGYLSRAAFLMDRMMGTVGLEGRAFVAMLSSVACAIPGIMATRTMPSARQRFATVMSLPLMTCSARMPVYTLLIGMLISSESKVWIFNAQGTVLFGLYLLGAISTMTVAKIISVFSQRRGPVMPFTMEMPPYRVPSWKLMLVEIWSPVKGFIRKAGTIILFATVVLWALLNLPMRSDADLESAGIDPSDSAAVSTYTMNHSVAARLGHSVEPVFDPLGFDWKTNVAVLSSLAARETFVATLGQMSAAEDPEDPATRLEEARYEDGSHKGDKVFTPPTIVALLIFFVYALQCTSTLAVLRRETASWRWPVIIFCAYSVLAWVMAYIAHTITVWVW